MVARPRHLSRIPRGTDISAAERGAKALGLTLSRQGQNVAGVMEAKTSRGTLLYEDVVVLMPRRATKTTSIWATLIGRCLTIPGYRVVTTAQDGTRAGQKIREHMELLIANDFTEGECRWSNGKERVVFNNGSLLWVVAPKPAVFRSAAADAILFDEAGELDPETGPALLAGALPLLDTRDDPQVIVTGTPSSNRAGLFWEELADGRDPREKSTGIVDYSIGDDEELAVVDDGTLPPSWARKTLADGTVMVLDEKLLRRVHPGLDKLPSTGRPLTTIERMRKRFQKMPVAQFEMEYGCRFPRDHTTHALDLDAWEKSGVEATERPDRVGIAFDVTPDGSASSLVYAWRVDGVAYIEVVAHRPGTSWLAGTSHRAAMKYRRTSKLAFDDIGANRDPATSLDRMRPKPTMHRLTTKDVMAAAQRFASDLHEDRMRHFGQADLDAAVDNAMWRDISKSGRAFGQRDTSAAAAPVCPLVAAAHALWSYDSGRDRVELSLG